MIAADPRTMSSAPVDGHRLLLEQERCRDVFGAGDYRAGWYSLDDDVIELDEPMGWEPLSHACARFENETASLMPEPVLP
jgi:hypothetical protein